GRAGPRPLEGRRERGGRREVLARRPARGLGEALAERRLAELVRLAVDRVHARAVGRHARLRKAGLARGAARPAAALLVLRWARRDAGPVDALVAGRAARGLAPA